MALQNSIEVTFSKEKETKNAVRFQEDTEPGERGIVGSIYVLKSQLEAIGNPNRLAVHITPWK